MAKMRIWYVTDVINSNSNFYVPVESTAKPLLKYKEEKHPIQNHIPQS